MFVPSSSALPTFYFDKNNAYRKNKKVAQDKTAATNKPKPNKFDQTTFEAALLTTVAFQNKPDNKRYYSL